MNRIILFLSLAIFSSISHAQNYKFGKVSKEELAVKAHTTHPDVNASVLYRELKTSFEYTQDKGFYIETEVFERVKIYNKEGFDWGTQKVRLYRASNRNQEEISGLKAVTYTLDEAGKIQETKLKSDGIFDDKKNKNLSYKKFTMPALTEGCIIEYKYKVKSPFISNIDTYKFQESIPVDKVKLRFEAPEYFNYKVHRRGWIPFKIEEEKIQRTMNYRRTASTIETGDVIDRTNNEQVKFFQNISTINLENVPPLIKEAYSGNLDNYTSSLKYELSYVQYPNSPLEFLATDWESVSKRIYGYDSFGGQLSKKGYFEKDLDPVLAEAQDAFQKMIATFEYAKASMKWNEYIGYTCDLGLKKAYKEREGNTADINLLLVAMLRHAGLTANPVLISSKSHGIPIFPTRNGFNYVIAGVEFQDQVILLDATVKLGAANVLQEELLNWNGRIVRENGSSEWVDLAPKKQALQAFMVNGTIDEEGTVSGQIKSQFTGNYALASRLEVHGVTEEDIEKDLESRYEKLDAYDAAVENVSNAYKPLKISYSFETTDFVEEIESDLYVSPMIFLGLTENPFKQEERKYPIDYGFAKKNKYIISLKMPEGYTVKSMPDSAQVKVEGNIIGFKYLISEKNGNLQLMMDFQINTSFLPAEGYQEIKNFYQYIIEKQNEKIVLTKA